MIVIVGGINVIVDIISVIIGIISVIEGIIRVIVVTKAYAADAAMRI